MELFSGFILGLLGSFHCAAMCGPISLSLPDVSNSKWAYLKSRMSYNFGRVLTYSFLGLIFGFLGDRIFMFGFQRSLTIVIGILVILSAVFTISGERLLLKINIIRKIFTSYKAFFRSLFGTRTRSFYLVFGVMNGFLPCGLVYVALSGAMITSDIFYGSVYMMLFGLGTFPMMMSVSYLKRGMSMKIRNRVNKLIPVFTIILGLLFILRGLNLGIPYISPSYPEQEKKTNEELICN